jgi:uncharacterized membrane protein YqhA
MSRLGSFSCFAIDTYAELSVVRKVLQGRFSPSSRTLLIEKKEGGSNYYLIGIALLIFGYSVYELVVSEIDPRHQEESELRRNLLNIDSLDSLKQKLTKVIIVALIVTAFKQMLSLEVSRAIDLLPFCGGVLMLSFAPC